MTLSMGAVIHHSAPGTHRRHIQTTVALMNMNTNSAQNTTTAWARAASIAQLYRTPTGLPT